MRKNKIVSLDELATIAQEHRANGEEVVLCHGAFDLMHIGHIRYLQRSRLEGDLLVVTVTADALINKGPGRPVFTETLRAENLAALAAVDYVAINYAPTATNVINLLQPSVYSKGIEYQAHEEDVTGNIKIEADAVIANGGRMFYCDEPTLSSSNLLNNHFDIFPTETKTFLEGFRKEFSIAGLNEALDSLRGLNVLVIGEAIIDQYHSVEPMAQTGKGNALSVRELSTEQFAGGAIAVANHVAGFCNNVTLVTALGERDSYEDFIRAKLLDQVEPVFAKYADAPTIVKRRFVDSEISKLFEVYLYEPKPKFACDGKSICDWLSQNAEGFDVVIAADFGNGFMKPEFIDILTANSKFLAVNTQINSGNRGFHVINQYPSADYVSLNEPELRLAMHDRKTEIETLCVELSRRMKVGNISVTRGTRGALSLHAETGQMCQVPALSTKVIDRVGAGDAFLSLSSILLGAGADLKVASFLGSIAAAIDVQIVCNRDPIDSIAVKKYCATLMK